MLAFRTRNVESDHQFTTLDPMMIEYKKYKKERGIEYVKIYQLVQGRTGCVNAVPIDTVEIDKVIAIEMQESNKRRAEKKEKAKNKNV